ncbi:hypothetical protein BGS_1200 [Beggiatoa sp. SS]|nr:hypothetical protein BGS_1200 [Beggiatoa sp. SS]
MNLGETGLANRQANEAVILDPFFGVVEQHWWQQEI